MNGRDFKVFYSRRSIPSSESQKSIDYLTSVLEVMKNTYGKKLFFHPNFSRSQDIYASIYVERTSQKYDFLENAMNHFLSPNAEYFPSHIYCSNKEDYGVVERILLDNFGKGIVKLNKLPIQLWQTPDKLRLHDKRK